MPTAMNGAVCAEHREVATRQRADLPEPQLVQRVDVGHDDGVGDGGQHRCHGGPGERQLHRRRTFAPERGDPVDHDRCERRPREREPDVDADALRAEHHDPEDDERRSTGVDAHDPGIGERVAGDALQDRAAQSEGCSGEDADQRTRHPDLTDDRLRRRAGIEVHERLEDRRRPDSAGAERDAEEADDREDADQHGEADSETGHGAYPWSGLDRRRSFNDAHARLASAFSMAAVSWVSCSAYSP